MPVHCVVSSRFQTWAAAPEEASSRGSAEAYASILKRKVPRKLMCPKCTGPMRRSHASSMSNPAVRTEFAQAPRLTFIRQGRHRRQMQHTVGVDFEHTLFAGFADGGDAPTQVVEEGVEKCVGRCGHAQQGEAGTPVSRPFRRGEPDAQ